MNTGEVIAKMDDHIWSSEHEVGEMISNLIRMSKMTDVMECGVWHGRTSAYMIGALPSNGCYTGIDIEDNRSDEVKEIMRDHKFLLGSSHDVLKKMPKRSQDLIFIDSVHEYDYLEVEFKLCEAIIKQNGLIVLHDAHLPGVNKWINYLKTMGWFEVVTFNTCDSDGNNRGVAIVKCLCV